MAGVYALEREGPVYAAQRVVTATPVLFDPRDATQRGATPVLETLADMPGYGIIAQDLKPDKQGALYLPNSDRLDPKSSVDEVVHAYNAGATIDSLRATAGYSSKELTGVLHTAALEKKLTRYERGAADPDQVFALTRAYNAMTNAAGRMVDRAVGYRDGVVAKLQEYFQWSTGMAISPKDVRYHLSQAYKQDGFSRFMKASRGLDIASAKSAGEEMFGAKRFNELYGAATSGKALHKKDFTLIELLVVVGIISVLAAMLLPVLSSAKQKARDAECMNNLRTLGQGIALYADDFDGMIPTHAAVPGPSGSMILSNNGALNGVGHALLFSNHYVTTLAPFFSPGANFFTSDGTFGARFFGTPSPCAGSDSYRNHMLDLSGNPLNGFTGRIGSSNVNPAFLLANNFQYSLGRMNHPIDKNGTDVPRIVHLVFEDGHTTAAPDPNLQSAGLVSWPSIFTWADQQQ